MLIPLFNLCFLCLAFSLLSSHFTWTLDIFVEDIILFEGIILIDFLVNSLWHETNTCGGGDSDSGSDDEETDAEADLCNSIVTNEFDSLKRDLFTWQKRYQWTSSCWSMWNQCEGVLKSKGWQFQFFLILQNSAELLPQAKSRPARASARSETAAYADTWNQNLLLKIPYFTFKPSS